MLRNGDLPGALRLLQMSQERYPSPQVESIIHQIEVLGETQAHGEGASRGNGNDRHQLKQNADSVVCTPDDPTTKPFVSILIATYNRARYLPAALQSALSQNYSNFEVVVVDDGSTQDTRSVVELTGDRRVRYIRKEHSGAPLTMNRGLAEAIGEYVIQLNDDDKMLPGALAMYVDLAKRHPDHDVIFGELEYIEEGKVTRDWKYPRYNGKVPLNKVFRGCPIPHGGSLIRKSLFERFGKFDPTFPRAFDWEWWSRVLPHVNVLHSGQFVYQWHIHSQSLTSLTAKDLSNVDTQFEAEEAEILRRMISRHSWQELFPSQGWNNPRKARAEAFLMAAMEFLRWGAKEDARKLLERSRKLVAIPATYFSLSHLAERDGDLRRALELNLCGLAVSPADEKLLAQQSQLLTLLSQAPNVNDRPRRRPKGRKFVNITIVTFNRLPYTQSCIEALHRNTFFPHVITAVDNGSTDGTPEWLTEMKRLGAIDNLILHPDNRGLAVAANDGWECEDSDYYMRLDNDIVIQKPGWLAPMVELLDRVPTIGMVGYNFEPTFFPLTTRNGFAIRLKPSGGNLGGGCLMVPRRTHEKLGFWAECFDKYGEEDAEYGLRVHCAGLLNAYLADEDIGLHLPDGRAARIDDELRIVSSEDPAYRQFKDEQRQKNYDLRVQMGQACQTGDRPLYQPRGEDSNHTGHASTETNMKGSSGRGMASLGNGKGGLEDGNRITEESPRLRVTPPVDKKIAAIYSNDPEFFACPYIRIWSPLSVSEEFGAIGGCSIAESVTRCNVKPATFADVIILQRDFPNHIEAVDRILAIARSRGVPVLLDTDDDLLNLPTEHPAAALSVVLRSSLDRIARQLDGFIVSTDYLATTFRKYGKPTYVVPNYVDDRIWRMEPLNRNPDKLIIGYMGTPTHREDLDCAIPALKELLRRYEGRLELWLWGDITEALRATPGVKMASPLNTSYPAFVRDFIANRPDIAVAPLRDIPFNRSKSPIKFYEYSILRIPGVYSKVGPYDAAVREGQTGLLVENTEENWTKALENLITDATLRNRIGATSRIEVMREHSISSKGGALSDVLAEVVRQAKVRRAPALMRSDFVPQMAEAVA